MNIFKKAYFYFQWKFYDTIPYAVTFSAYLDKVEIDEWRKKCGDPLLKDRIRGIWEAGAKEDKRLKEALVDMVRQFAYNGHDKIAPFYHTGGLSALEHAFEVLGWEDPHSCPENKCQIDKCPEFATTGSPTKNGYKRMCGKHYQKYSIK